MNELRCLRAIDRGDLDLIKQLIDSGHDFNGGVGQRKMPPVIYYAVQKNFDEAVGLLVNAGVNVNVKYTAELKTPLYVSAYIGSQTITTILCQSGADVNEPTLKGETPLFAAIDCIALSRDLNLVKILLANGADVNVVAVSGQTPLTKAIEIGCAPAVKLLIEQGAHLDVTNWQELKYALKLNNYPIVEYLLDCYKSRVNDQNVVPNESVVDLCLQYLNLKAMKRSIELGFRASDKLVSNPMVVLKTLLPSSDPNFSDAMYCFDYLMTFRHLIDFKHTFAFKCDRPNNTKIVYGNLLTYALLFNCSYMAQQLIRIGVTVEYSFFSSYRFDHKDVVALKMLHSCGLRFPNKFASKCYPNSTNTEDKALNRQEFKEFCQWIESESSKPRPLTQIIRISLRNQFGTRLTDVFTHIRLPKSLVSFLLLDHL